MMSILCARCLTGQGYSLFIFCPWNPNDWKWMIQIKQRLPFFNTFLWAWSIDKTFWLYIWAVLRFQPCWGSMWKDLSCLIYSSSEEDLLTSFELMKDLFVFPAMSGFRLTFHCALEPLFSVFICNRFLGERVEVSDRIRVCVCLRGRKMELFCCWVTWSGGNLWAHW